MTIGNGVKSIGEYVFGYCSSLTSVTIPDSITTIDYYAFDGCDSLAYNEENGLKYLGNPDNPYLYLMKANQDIETAQINNRCKVIVDRAFFNCSGLTNITIPNSVTSIGVWAFRYCSKLTSVTIGNGVTSIELGAFDNCTNLKNIVLFPSVPPTLDTNSIPGTVSNIYVQ